MYTIIIIVVIITVIAMEGVASFKAREKMIGSFYSYMYHNTTYSIFSSKNRQRPLFRTELDEPCEDFMGCSTVM
jgi:hypothetical protein